MATVDFPWSANYLKSTKSGICITGAEPLSGEPWNTAAPVVRGYAAKVY